MSGPLSMFQATAANREETRQLVTTINSQSPRPVDNIEETFDVWWPKLEEALKGLSDCAIDERPLRPDRELLEEVLSRVRMIPVETPPIASTLDRSDMYRLMAERSARNVIRRSGNFDIETALKARDRAYEVLKEVDGQQPVDQRCISAKLREIATAVTIAVVKDVVGSRRLSPEIDREELRRTLIDSLLLPSGV